MLKCRKMRGLIAASIYEDLQEDQEELLDSHLKSCPACMAQVEKLQKVARFFQNRVPADNGTLNIDLLPAIRRQLHHDRVWQGGQGRRAVGWQLGFLGAMCMVAVGTFSYQVYQYVTPPSAMASRPAGDTVASANAPSLRAELEKASLLTHKHDYVDAYKAVQQAIQQYHDDPFLGLAYLQLADLAYTHLKWYPEAYDAYETLVKVDPKVYTENSEIIARRNLLAEARPQDFAPLHKLDAALRSVDQLAQLEKVIANNPSSLIAGVAVENMAKIAAEEVAGDAPDGQHQHVLALECARDRCKLPVVRDRLNIEIGPLYRELNNPAKARDVFAAAAKSENATLAQLAANSLVELGGK